MIIVSDVLGALTHVRHRDDTAARLREVVALSLDVLPDGFNVQVDFDVMGPPSLQLEGSYRTKTREPKIVENR